MTYNQFLSLNADSSSLLQSDSKINKNLSIWTPGEALRCQGKLAWLFIEARKHLKLEGKEEVRVDEILATWSDE